MRRTTGCEGSVIAPARMCELAIALLLLLLVSCSGRARARAPRERPEPITEARLFSSADIPETNHASRAPIIALHPSDASVNVKDRARVHFTFRCAPKD